MPRDGTCMVGCVCPGVHAWGYACPGGCAGACVPGGYVHAQWHACPGGHVCRGGVHVQGRGMHAQMVCMPGGMCAQGGVMMKCKVKVIQRK